MPGFVNIAITFLVGLLGSAFGAGVAWMSLKGRVSKLEEKNTALEVRVKTLEDGIEKDRIRMADRLARIEVKVDDIRERVNRVK